MLSDFIFNSESYSIMKREIKKHLYDIKISIELIYECLGDKRDFLECQNNKLLRRA